MDPRRLLPVGDRQFRYAYATLGIFALTLERAGAACGRQVATRIGADPGAAAHGDTPVVVGHVELGDVVAPSPEAARCLHHRRTSRLPYDARHATAVARQRLHLVAERHGHELRVEDDPARVRWLLKENAHAIIANLQHGDERRELAQWVRVDAHTPEVGDGLWSTPLGQPRWEIRAGFSAPWSFKLWGLSQLAVNRYVQTMGATPHVALLRGPFTTWPELVAAGRCLMDLWLELSAHDLYMHPFGSTLTNPTYADRIANFYGAGDGWLIFRFGHSAPPPASPRLPLEEVMR